MLERQRFIELVADLLNRSPRPQTREQRVRDAHRVLYRQVVNKRATDAEADLALAEVAHKEQS